MKRIVLAFSILFFIVIYTLAGVCMLNKINSRLLFCLTEIKDCYESDNYEKTKFYADKLDDEWNKYKSYMSIFVPDDKILDINISISKIKPYLDESNNELIAETECLENQIKMMYHAEIPTWYNIL